MAIEQGQTGTEANMESQLPTIAEIRASTDALTAAGRSTTVVRVGQHFAVKFGLGQDLREAETMRYVRKHCSNVLVPKVYGTLVDESTGHHFIVMEYLAGETLEKCLPFLDTAEKAEVCRQLKCALEELRGLPSPGYIGSVRRSSCMDSIFWTPPPVDPPSSGPFDTESEMNEGILKCLARTESASYITFLRSLVQTTLRDHRVCFAHADLQAKNIMITRTPRKVASGTTGGDQTCETDVKVYIIDWEMAGWYPEYWEFCNASFLARFKPAWQEIVSESIDAYVPEYLMMQVLRGILLY